MLIDTLFLQALEEGRQYAAISELWILIDGRKKICHQLDCEEKGFIPVEFYGMHSSTWGSLFQNPGFLR